MGGLFEKIGIGNMLTIGLLLISGGTSWAVLNSKTEDVAKAAVRIEKSLDKIETRIDRLEDKSAQIHEKQVEMEVRLSAIERQSGMTQPRPR